VCFNLFVDAIIFWFPQGYGIQASTTLGQAGLDFEKNILRHMEMDMNATITYLQNKGLCLIPITQATAISNRTGKPGLGSPVTDFVASIIYRIIYKLIYSIIYDLPYNL
jgi:hypothetical protein